MTPTVIAFPGTLCSPAIFKPTQEALGDACDFQTVSWMDEPAHEDGTAAHDSTSNKNNPDASPARHSIPAVAARAAATITQPAILLGHSTGGAIAAYLAATAPHLVRGLVLINTGAHMRRHGDVARLIATLTEPEPSGGGGKDKIAAAVLQRSFAEQPDPAIMAEFEAYAAGVTPRAVLEVLQSQAALDLAPVLKAARVACPVVVVHGVLDRARSRADAEELAACFDEGAATVRWAECGHTPPFESPEAVVAAVREIIARLG